MPNKNFLDPFKSMGAAGSTKATPSSNVPRVKTPSVQQPKVSIPKVRTPAAGSPKMQQPSAKPSMPAKVMRAKPSLPPKASYRGKK